MAKRAPPGGKQFPPQKKGGPKKATRVSNSPKGYPQQAPVSQPAPAMQSTSQMGAQLPPAPVKRGIY